MPTCTSWGSGPQLKDRGEKKKKRTGCQYGREHIEIYGSDLISKKFCWKWFSLSAHSHLVTWAGDIQSWSTTCMVMFPLCTLSHTLCRAILRASCLTHWFLVGSVFTGLPYVIDVWKKKKYSFGPSSFLTWSQLQCRFIWGSLWLVIWSWGKKLLLWSVCLCS